MDVQLTREAEVLMNEMATVYATRCLDEMLLPTLGRTSGSRLLTVPAVQSALLDAYSCLETVYGRYAFARRGKERTELAAIAVEALRRTTSRDDFGQFLSLPDAGPLWDSFVAICREHGKKPMEQLNIGVVAGMAELVQELHQTRGSGSIVRWIVESVEESGRVEEIFVRITDVRGIGPKVASLLLRDTVLLFDLERRLHPLDRLYVQPIDKWLRLIAPHVVNEPNVDTMADWVLAGKLAKYCRKAGVSGVRFNLGASYFGSRDIRQPEHVARKIAAIVDSGQAARLGGEML
ncbi:MAG: hypothetical protein SNJ74_11515 [Fimbriimonadaceae bacterium]